MSKFSNKVASVILTVTTAATLSGFGSFVAVAGAQSASDIQTQINALLATLANLQSQLNNSTGGNSACSFTRDLTVGSKGADVTCLQQVLASKGHFSVSPTGYFGSITKAAVMAWQTSAGITPASGYFGAKSRAAFTGSVNTGTGTGTGVSLPAGSTLNVTLAGNNPIGSAIAGAGQINAGRFAFTAPAGAAVTVTGLTFNKVGVVSDSNINNLYLANAATGEVVAQFQSLTNSVATFSGLNLMIPAGQTWTGELRLDLSSSASAGNTLAWQLKGVTATGATVTGLPVSTASLTVTSVSNPSLSTMTLTANAVGSTVDAGTASVLVSSWTANVSNSKVKLTNMQFSMVGSANPGDVQNLRLLVNGTQVATLAAGATNTNFNFPEGIVLNTGNSTIQLFADINGSPNRTLTFSLLQPFKVTAIDTQYNTGITVSITSTNQTTITINTGSITVSLASDTPTAPIPVGASGVTLLRARIYAAGEAVKVKFLDATISQVGSGTNWATAPTDDIQNIRLIDDVGGQVGNAINTVAGGSSSGQCTLASGSITCHFGTSGSPINYIVPANTVRVVSLVVDILSGADVTTLQGSLPGNSTNLEGQTSFQSASSGSVTGATLAVTTTPLTVAVNSAFNSPTFIAGSNNARVASFIVTASSAQGATLSSLTFDKDSNANFDMQNMKVMIGSTQFGTTRPTISDAETSLAFSAATPVTVPQGGSVTIDVYADILTSSTAATHSAVIDIIGWSALGSISNSAITFPGAVNGQSIVISSGPTLTVATGSDTAPSKYVVMGSTGNALLTIRLTADNVEDIRVTDISLTDTVGNGSAGIASFQNVTLWNGSTQVAGPISMTMSGSSVATATFSLNPVIVPKNGTVNLVVKGDVATYSSGGATSNSTHAFGLSQPTYFVTAYGKDSNTSATKSGSASGNTVTVYRTKLSLSSAVLGSSTGRTRVAVDDLATLNFTADSAYQAVVGTVTVKFSGQAVSNGSTAFTVDLLDANTNSALGSAAQQTCTPGAGNSCSVTFNPSYTVDPGTTKAAKVRVNSSSFYNGSNTSDSLSALINAASGITFNDGTTSNISIESTVVPFTIANVSYE